MEPVKRECASATEMLEEENRDSGAGGTAESTRRTLRYDEGQNGAMNGYQSIAETTSVTNDTPSDEDTKPVVHLGNDWAQVLDEPSGEIYYCNLKTGETSWSKPFSVPPPTPLESADLRRSSTMPHTRSEVYRSELYGQLVTTGESTKAPPPVPFLRSDAFTSGAGFTRTQSLSRNRTTPGLLNQGKSSTQSSSLHRRASELPSVTRPWERFSKRFREALPREMKESFSRESNSIENKSKLDDSTIQPPLRVVTSDGDEAITGGFKISHPRSNPPVSPPFARGKNETSFAKIKVLKEKNSKAEKPQWRSPSPKDSARDAKAKAAGSRLRLARAEAPQVSQTRNTTYSTIFALSPRRSSGSMPSSPKATRSPSPQTLAKLEVLKRRSGSARKRMLDYGEQVRSRAFAETDVVVHVRPRSSISPTTSVSPIRRTSSAKSDGEFSRAAGSAPSPTARVSSVKMSRTPSVSRSNSIRRSSSLKSSTSSPKASPKAHDESHNPFAAMTGDEAAAVTMQARIRGFLARKRAKEIRAWAARKTGAEQLRAEDQIQKEAEVQAKLRVKAERSRKMLTPGLIGSFDNKSVSPRTSVERKPSLARNEKSLSRKESVKTEAVEQSVPVPEPELTLQPASVPQVEPEQVVLNVPQSKWADTQNSYPFEEYAESRFSETKPEPQKPSSCFGCFKAKAAVKGPSFEVLARYSATPLDSALTESANTAGIQEDSQLLFRSLLAAAGDDEASNDHKTGLFFTPHVFFLLKHVELGVTDDEKGQAMRDEWYCQVLKQTSKNPSKKKELRVWRLLYLVSCAFAPSNDLAPYVLERCAQVMKKGARIDKNSKNTSGGESRSSSIESISSIIKSVKSSVKQVGKSAKQVGKQITNSLTQKENEDLSLVEIAGWATLVRARLIASLEQGASFDNLHDNRRARAADRAVVDTVPGFGATLEEIVYLEAMERKRVRSESLANSFRSPAFSENAQREAESGKQSSNSSDPVPDAIAPSPSAPTPRALHALLQNLETSGTTERRLFRASADEKAVASSVANSAASFFEIETAAAEVSCSVASELVKIWLMGLALPVIPLAMHQQCLDSEATPEGVTKALGDLPAMHRVILTRVLRAAAAAAAADGGGLPSSVDAAKAAEAIAAELAPCLMHPSTGSDHDMKGREVFVTRLIRMMLMRA